MTEIDLKKKGAASPLIRAFYTSPMTGQEIEERSFEMINGEAPPHRFTQEEWQVVRRMIHASGDFTLMDAIRFSPDAIPSAVEALLGRKSIYVDSNMIRSGLSLARLQSVNSDYRPEDIACYVSDMEIARLAQESNLPRSLFAVRRAASILDGGIAVFGNSPIGLLELNRMIIEEEIKPSFVISMPVALSVLTKAKKSSRPWAFPTSPSSEGVAEVLLPSVRSMPSARWLQNRPQRREGRKSLTREEERPSFFSAMEVVFREPGRIWKKWPVA